jgi:hypothetical protein
MRRTIVLAVFILVFSGAGGPVLAEEDGESRKPVTRWLVMGPLSQPLWVTASEGLVPFDWMSTNRD